MFCRISLFSFSMAPFWHEEFGSAICIYIRIKCLASPLMMDEFRPIIGCCGFDVYLVRHKPPDYRFCQSLGILPLVEFSHEQHVGTPLDDSNYCPMSVFAYDGIHLEVSESFAVNLHGVLGYACPVRDLYVLPYMVCFLCFRRGAVFVQFSSVFLVLVYIYATSG